MEFLPETLPHPIARAWLAGDAAHPTLRGEVLFHRYGSKGALLVVRASGLPPSAFLALHIHATADCATGGDIPFAHAGGHYDPHGREHPHHSGDLPPLLSSEQGTALLAVYTDRFTPAEVVGRAVVIHEQADDFRSQPSGDSGGRIACGPILTLPISRV